MLSIVMPVRVLSDEIAAMTYDNIERLAENTTGEWELIVVFSGEGCSLPLDDRVFTVVDDRGLAGMWNTGCMYAEGGVICCIHNDVEVDKGWNVSLLEAAQDGAIAFPYVREDDIECQTRGVAPTSSTGMPPGCCFAFSRDTYVALGGFDEGFKGFHFEDTDMFLRAMKAGIPLKRASTSVFHGRGKTRTSVVEENNENYSRNAEIYSDKHGEMVNGGQWAIPLPTFSQEA